MPVFPNPLKQYNGTILNLTIIGRKGTLELTYILIVFYYEEKLSLKNKYILFFT